MTEFLTRHTGWELVELFVAEKQWPTGEPAENWRAMMQANMEAANRGSAPAARAVRKIWRRLCGKGDPEVVQKGVSKKELKSVFGI